MYNLSTETIIPKYSIEPDIDTGNSMFKITKPKYSINRQRSDFLIPHRKDYYFFVFVKQGASRHWIDMTPYTLKPDTFYFTIPQQVHLKEEAKPLTCTSISFTEEFLAMQENQLLKQLPVIQNLHNGHELNLSADNVVFIDDILEKIYAEYHSKYNWQQSMLMAYLQVLLIYVSRLYQKKFSNSELFTDRLFLKKYLSKIDESYAELHEVADYADMLNISAGHLSELVKEQSGKPAIAHIHERLILEAKRLLFHKNHSVKEIAFQLGFEDPSYFNRFFKRLIIYSLVT